jgi:hypothetical protein
MTAGGFAAVHVARIKAAASINIAKKKARVEPGPNFRVTSGLAPNLNLTDVVCCSFSR